MEAYIFYTPMAWKVVLAITKTMTVIMKYIGKWTTAGLTKVIGLWRCGKTIIIHFRRQKNFPPPLLMTNFGNGVRPPNVDQIFITISLSQATVAERILVMALSEIL